MKRKEAEAEGAFPWAELPLGVQTIVLGWLPLRSLLRSKSVCKLWNSTISAPHFLHFPSLFPSPSPPPWLIFFNPKLSDSLLAFDFGPRSWFSLDMGFLSSLTPPFMAPVLSSSPHIRPLIWCTGSAHGRLLLEFGPHFHVCNPLTKSLFTLPAFNYIRVPITHGFSTAHIRVHTTHVENAGRHDDACVYGNACIDGHDYTIVVIGNAKPGLVIEAYRASRNAWDIVGSIPTDFIIKHDQMMECNGLLYSLLLNPTGMLVVGEGDETGGSNWRIQALPTNNLKERRRLLACQNALFMACTMDENSNFVIWRFQPGARSWTMIHNMPDAILEDVKNISLSNWVDCVGVGNFICLRALGSLKVLAYDLSEATWSWLPELPHSCDAICTRGLQFEPRLDYRSN